MSKHKSLFLIILAILILGFVTFWQLTTFNRSLSDVKFPSFEVPETQPFGSSENITFQEFKSPDGKLKVEYPSDWIKMVEESLSYLNQETVKEGAKILLFAQKFKLEKGSFASLVIQEINLEEEQSLEETVEQIKKDLEEKGGELEVLESEVEDKIAYLKLKYKREEGTILYSKEKIILEENKAYIVAVITLDIHWSEFEPETEEIFNSTKIIN